jgi:hypothetical protein
MGMYFYRIRAMRFFPWTSLDPDVAAFVAASGAIDTSGINRLAIYLKAENLWSNTRFYPLKSAQNAGSGSTAYGLGGLTANNMALVNSPTWGAGGITFNDTTQYGAIADFLGDGDLVAGVRRTGLPVNNGYSWAQYDTTANDRSWAILENSANADQVQFNRTSDGTTLIEVYASSVSPSYISSNAQYVASWIGSSVAGWRDKTSMGMNLTQNSISTRHNAACDITLNCRLGNGVAAGFAGGLYTASWVCNASITTTQRETITDLINAL